MRCGEGLGVTGAPAQASRAGIAACGTDPDRRDSPGDACLPRRSRTGPTILQRREVLRNAVQRQTQPG